MSSSTLCQKCTVTIVCYQLLMSMMTVEISRCGVWQFWQRELFSACHGGGVVGGCVQVERGR